MNMLPSSCRELGITFASQNLKFQRNFARKEKIFRYLFHVKNNLISSNPCRIVLPHWTAIGGGFGDGRMDPEIRGKYSFTKFHYIRLISWRLNGNLNLLLCNNSREVRA